MSTFPNEIKTIVCEYFLYVNKFKDSPGPDSPQAFIPPVAIDWLGNEIALRVWAKVGPTIERLKLDRDEGSAEIARLKDKIEEAKQKVGEAATNAADWMRRCDGLKRDRSDLEDEIERLKRELALRARPWLEKP